MAGKDREKQFIGILYKHKHLTYIHLMQQYLAYVSLSSRSENALDILAQISVSQQRPGEALEPPRRSYLVFFLYFVNGHGIDMIYSCDQYHDNWGGAHSGG